MYYRGLRFVDAERLDGTFGEVDVVDLDEESFRGWITATLVRLETPSETTTPPATVKTARLYRERRPPIRRQEAPLGGAVDGVGPASTPTPSVSDGS